MTILYRLYCWRHGLCAVCVKPMHRGESGKTYCPKCSKVWAYADAQARAARRATAKARELDIIAGAMRLRGERA
jgi:uncharacterized Zn finger protein (UPF0148 family)